MPIIKKTLAQELQAPVSLDDTYSAVIYALTTPVPFKEGLMKYRNIKHLCGPHHEFDWLDPNDQQVQSAYPGWARILRVTPMSGDYMWLLGAHEAGVSRLRATWDVDPSAGTINSVVAGATFMKEVLGRAAERLGGLGQVEIVPIKG